MVFLGPVRAIDIRIGSNFVPSLILKETFKRNIRNISPLQILFQLNYMFIVSIMLSIINSDKYYAEHKWDGLLP